MVKHGLEAAIISDPVNIRYVTGTRNTQVFIGRNPPARYLLLRATRSIVFEFTDCPHLAQGYETVDEVRTAKSVTFTSSSPKIHVRLVGKRSATVGLKRINAKVAIALKELGLNIVDAQQAMEMAVTIKSSEEAKCIVAPLRATEVAVGKLRDSIAPGLAENQL
ncbi:peptidase yqhT [Fusarium pseudocircinatum]|uniref:Peptidase yqhT n=1 Tax=Fusarium pseudocircinatum TaxID=56676 RepID=A0A8H5L9I4_9HYPO|nr:peptidase yqhT [Fusarium pseudocircinatum]